MNATKILCANRNDIQFGEERLLTYLRAAVAEPLPRILAGLESSLERRRESEEFDDDVSVLALEFTCN